MTSGLIRAIAVVSTLLAPSFGLATPVSFVADHTFFDTGLVSRGIAVAPTGEHVYVGGTNADNVGIFARDALTGSLTLLEVVPNLTNADGITVSSDGAFVYVAGGRLRVFSRDGLSGSLTLVTSYGVETTAALFGVIEPRITPDGVHLYSVSLGGDALVGFSRDGVTGELTLIGQAVDGSGGVDGLDGAIDLAISPDGNHVYTAARDDHAVAVFSRDVGTGALTFVEAHFDNVSGVDGLSDAEDVAVSPDGAHVYVAGEGGVAVFSRDAGTGALTFVETDTDGTPEFASGVAISPDGGHVYLVMGTIGDTRRFRTYDRDAGTGEVTLVQELTAGENGIPETGGSRVIANADGEYIYTTGGAQAVFRHTAVSCSTTPLGGCTQPTQPGAAKLLVKDDPFLDQKDKVVWKFLKGPATTEGDFGDPAGTLNDYALCVYDGSASGVFLEAVIPAGGGCGKAADHGGVACWSAVPGKGFKYKRKDTQPHGILAAKLFAGAAGKTKLIVKGKKDLLPLGSGTPALPVTVQLQNRAGECWEAVYSSALANDGVVFKANSD